MGPKPILGGVLATFAVVMVIYGLHRIGLWMEGRGWLYYQARRSGGGSRGFIALQEFLEPPARHVFHIEDHQRWRLGEEVPGAGEPPRNSQEAASSSEQDPPSGGPRG
jgi:hypothetical protein